MVKEVYKVVYRNRRYSDKEEYTIVSASSLDDALERAKQKLNSEKYEIVSVNQTGKHRIEDVTDVFPHSHYTVDIPLDYLEENVLRFSEHYQLDIDPDFQRGYVWSEEQQVRYVEYILRGGVSSNIIYFNCPNWEGSGDVGQMVLVDGKQRLTALRKFAKNELKVFGHQTYQNLFDAKSVSVKFCINNLNNKLDVLKWYKGLNVGGTVHTKEDLDKVDVLIKEETDKN